AAVPDRAGRGARAVHRVRLARREAGQARRLTMKGGARIAVTRAFICACLAAALHAPALYARTLHWASLDVTANLEAAGRLHVVERQAIVFDGDWNGGERRFRLLGSQRLEPVGMRKVAPATGTAVPLRRGKLNDVDN